MITPIAFLLLNNNRNISAKTPSEANKVHKLKVLPETPAQKAKRMKWWKDDRFGMFIHWGLYSVPAGTWNGPGGIPGTDYAEWIRNDAQIPIRTYEKFEKKFDPVKFNALSWVKMAKNAGMRYIVITTKHHDGFNMFASHYSKFNVMNTPWHHDPMKDLEAACKKEGMTLGFYHSIMDWHRHDYLPRRPWELATRPVGNAKFSRYVTYLKHELHQLLTNYGPIGVLWFDGNWESTWNDQLGTEIYNYCRKIQPNIIINNRVGASGQIGDYFTPEQHIPDTGYGPGQYWETCMTMNDHWGYNKLDHNYKSVTTIIHNLVDIVSKGGNYLLNVGPTAQGTFPPQAIQLLQQIGDWMHVNSKSIYHTNASVFKGLTWGRSTTREHKHFTQLFLDVEKWPTDGTLVVPGIGNKPIRAHILGSNKSLAVSRDGSNLDIKVPERMPNPICTVVELDVHGKPIIYTAPVIQATSKIFYHNLIVPIVVPHGLTVRYTTNGSSPNSMSPVYHHPIRLTSNHNVEIRAAGFVGMRRVTQQSVAMFHKSNPLQAIANWMPKPGITRIEFGGNFKSVTEFPVNPTGTQEIPLTRKVVSSIQLPNAWGLTPKEDVGLIFRGGLKVAKTGVYQFQLTSDDGSELMIDGNVVVNNDGLHTATPVIGAVALAAGYHKIKVMYFNQTGGAALRLEWSTSTKPWSRVSGPLLVH